MDPNVLLDLEKQAHKIASNLDYIMDNLRNSLHAVSVCLCCVRSLHSSLVVLYFLQMTVCAKQSVMLHRESVDNLHSVVDTNVKVGCTYVSW